MKKFWCQIVESGRRGVTPRDNLKWRSDVKKWFNLKLRAKLYKIFWSLRFCRLSISMKCNYGEFSISLAVNCFGTFSRNEFLNFLKTIFLKIVFKGKLQKINDVINKERAASAKVSSWNSPTSNLCFWGRSHLLTEAALVLCSSKGKCQHSSGIDQGDEYEILIWQKWDLCTFYGFFIGFGKLTSNSLNMDGICGS